MFVVVIRLVYCIICIRLYEALTIISKNKKLFYNYLVLHHYDNKSIILLSLKVGRCVEHPEYYLAISLNLFIFIF